MGMLKHCVRKSVHILSSQNLVGRVPGCQLRFEKQDGVSRHHAEISWNRPAWEVRDLAGRNGTYVDGRQLAKGETCKLALGSIVAFGREDNALELVDDTPPVASATRQDGQRQVADGETLYLPDQDGSECMIHRWEGRWVIDWPDRESLEIESGTSVVVGGEIWTCDLPIDIERTIEMRHLSLEGATLLLRVSRDQEHVEVEFRQGSNRISIEARNHWYTLVVMARERLREAEHGVVPAEAGWVDIKELHRMLDMPEATFNTHIFRAKQQLANLGIQGHHLLVERRRSLAIRIGIGNLLIEDL